MSNFDDIYDADESALQDYYRKIAFRELFSVLGDNYDELGTLNILEIAAEDGRLTRELLQKCKHVRAIDPLLAIQKHYNNLTKEIGRFDENTNCSNYDLLISCSPCGIEESIASASRKYNIPFFIILCSCRCGFQTKEERYFYLKERMKNTTLYKGECGIWYWTNLRVKNHT